MASILDHRGPDEKGFHVCGSIGFAQSRLSVIDITGGQQPMFNEDGSIVLVFNGEIFNYLELGTELRKKGHLFKTRSDTEVVVHAYEEYGSEFLTHLNGQFAIALWDEKQKSLILARDRVGIRPLFYAVLPEDTFIFASEMKALFCHPELKAEIDPAGLNQVFTLWVNIPPRTVFKNVYEVPAAHQLIISSDQVKSRKYWSLSFPTEYVEKTLSYYEETLSDLLLDAVAIRLRADVPVASYLSGGIDSAIITSLVKMYHDNDLITFSVGFSDQQYDERWYQELMVDHLKTDHRMIEVDYDMIANVLPEVIWFCEKPLLKTAPAPLYILSGLVRENGIKVVLTGEGADEVFGGYNIFKEDKIRRFWARYPDSKIRPHLLGRLYPYVNTNSSIQNFWQMFFKKNLRETENPHYSHLIRWTNTAQIKQYFTDDYQSNFSDLQLFDDLNNYLNPDMNSWHPLSRAQYLEMQLFMSEYLLSSQGDRMMMGHSVEGRFPFLDHRIIEFANTIPPVFKLNVLNEKYLLKKTFHHLLPHKIINRVKHPYRAPIYQCFKNNSFNLARKLMEYGHIENFGYFNNKKVKQLLEKANQADQRPLSARDNMALIGVSSLQLLHHHYISAH